jgi:hypothetical protein
MKPSRSIRPPSQTSTGNLCWGRRDVLDLFFRVGLVLVLAAGPCGSASNAGLPPDLKVPVEGKMKKLLFVALILAVNLACGQIRENRDG